VSNWLNLTVFQSSRTAVLKQGPAHLSPAPPLALCNTVCFHVVAGTSLRWKSRCLGRRIYACKCH